MSIKFYAKHVYLLLAMCLASSMIYAQTTVTGTVTSSEDSEALGGVTVVVKNTQIGAFTGEDGSFTLNVPDPNATLLFRYVGYQDQEIALSGRTTLNVTMQSDFALDEVVVVGYGTVRKSDATGAVTGLKEDDFNVGVITAPEQLLQGRAAGVQISQNGGEPGAGSTIRIRGVGSVRSNNDPLYVIDGVPLSGSASTPDASNFSGIDAAEAKNPLNFLNPSDIESIDILKDASATAIYGARGANGVVIITTKKGQAGKGALSYGTFVSVSNVLNQLDVLSADEFRAAQRDVQTFFNTDADPNNDITDDQLAARDFGANTNWQDEIFRTALSHQHNLAFSGGSNSTTYRASLSVLDQEGVVINSGIRRYTGRINTTHKAINDRLKVQMNFTTSHVQDDRAPIGSTGGFEGDIIINALRLNPTMPVRNPDGTLFQPQDNENRNPVAFSALTSDEVTTLRFLGNLSAEFEIVEGLKAKVNYGLDNARSDRAYNASPNRFDQTGNGGRSVIANRVLASELLESFLTYDVYQGDHGLNLLAGYSFQSFNERSSLIDRTNFATDEITGTNAIGLSSDEGTAPSSSAQENELQSFFGRVNYSYQGRYLLTATFRRDGSTRFGENNKYGNFPSFAGAWKISEESFMQNVKALSGLKLRAGWGLTGNQEIPNKLSLESVGVLVDNNGNNTGNAILNGNTFNSGLGLNRVPNPDLKWEQTRQINVGLDFEFLDGRINASVDYFDRVTTDFLLEIKAPDPAPTTNVFTNVDGEIINRGFEFAITSVNVDKNDFRWMTDFNFTTISNTVEGLPVTRINTGRASGQGLSGTLVQIITNDEPIGTFFGREWTGFDENGVSTFADADGDGTADQVVLGNPIPDFTWGINNTFTYKQFDLSFFINGVQGNEIYNNTANSVFTRVGLATTRNTSPDAANSAESFGNALSFSSRFIEDGSFIRLNNATLGYTFDASNVEWLSNLRLYVTGTNLLLFTDYSGFDPEVNTDANENNVPSIGIDYSNYPSARTFLFGANINFN
ncbi:MAG: TonB-dependent receptor [Bacteroidota bacterium]